MGGLPVISNTVEHDAPMKRGLKREIGSGWGRGGDKVKEDARRKGELKRKIASGAGRVRSGLKGGPEEKGTETEARPVWQAWFGQVERDAPMKRGLKHLQGCRVVSGR